MAELVRRGIDRDAAQHSTAAAERIEDERLRSAIDKLFRIRPLLGYPSAARALERLGFPAHAIYRQLRVRAQAQLGDRDAFARENLRTARGAEETLREPP